MKKSMRWCSRRRMPDGRLILSKKRARFEKAWRRIEAAADWASPSKVP